MDSIFSLYARKKICLDIKFKREKTLQNLEPMNPS